MTHATYKSIKDVKNHLIAGITVKKLMSLDPCPEYTTARVTELWNGRKTMTLCKIMDLDIPADDRIWAVTKLMPERESRLFAADCAESAFDNISNAELKARAKKLIKKARCRANGDITAEQLAAYSAAYSAADSAADMEAYSAAYSAAYRSAYRAADSAADSAAYRAADSAAYRAAEREKQLVNLRRYCEIIELEESDE